MKAIVQKILKKAGYQLCRYETTLANPSYSQCGEDAIIEYIFRLRKIKLPTYLDIGANDPVFLNNTYKFYLRGSTGINIEPNAALIKEYKKRRSKDINLNIGISTSKGEMLFYMFDDNTFNTFSKEEADGMVASGRKLIDKKLIKTYPLSEIIDQYCKNTFPDFLTIDVEGLDYDIVQSIDFTKSFPKVICLETAEYSSIGAGKKRVELMNFIAGKGYTLYADTNLNSIYVKNEFWFI